MTMNRRAEPQESAQPQVAIVSIRGDRVDMSDLVGNREDADTTWTSPPGVAYGLRADQGDTFAQATLDPGSFSVAETQSENATSELVALVRLTFLRYLGSCLRIGHFALEAVPVEAADGGIKHESLRLALAAAGAAWMSDLPRAIPSRGRVPRRAELTVIEPPAPPAPEGGGGSR